MKRHIFFLLAVSMALTLHAQVTTGDARVNEYLPLLKNQRVAIMSNHTGVIVQDGEVMKDAAGENMHVLDMLLNKKVNVVAIFSPEHGFRGTAKEGEIVKSSIDDKTGVPILSLYDGTGGRPSDESMALFDVLIIDIQDVGLRFYTYYVTMIKLMEACAEQGKKVIVMDRPNPNGHYVDGPILDMKHKSGVGYLPIPVVHGMTLGELALMANGEKWLKEGRQCDLTVIPCKGYTHQTFYRLPVAPSPNLRTMLAVYLYPSMCYFEATPVSLGRGTDKPFMIYGHPLYRPIPNPSLKGQGVVSESGNRGIGELVNRGIGEPITFTPANNVQGGRKCHGVDLSKMSEEEARTKGIDLTYLIDAYRALYMDNYFFRSFFELLIGQDYVRKMIIQGKTNEEIRLMWQDDVAKFKEQRRPYLLYEE